MPDPNNFLFSVASGEQRSRGIELDVIGRVSDGFNIVANYAYIDGEITEDNADAGGNSDKGNKLFNVPEHNANLWATYEIQKGPLTGLTIGGGVNVVSERFGDNANSFLLDGYVLANALIAYEKDDWRAALNFRNLFDVDYIEGTGNSRNSEINPGEGFTVIGSLSVEF
ncbi:TonB-dependent siderophore receptor [[Leptolyngbya] sp. PCC 7376]|uniref:TonB-dependent siderophore receptor n=1 Tax=[Leptolyngbya] sp. PCC 7376 TaxID=111781 RepID=UPI001CED8487|nr:TonB-dependent receptor [[Leptolyngbya] sp. PCC 7376]